MDARIELSRLTNDVAQALKAWHKNQGDTSPFEGLQLFQQMLGGRGNLDVAEVRVRGFELG